MIAYFSFRLWRINKVVLAFNLFNRHPNLVCIVNGILCSTLLSIENRNNTGRVIYHPLVPDFKASLANNIEKGYRMRLKGCGLSSPKGYAGDLVLIITNIECNDITINKRMQLKFCILF